MRGHKPGRHNQVADFLSRKEVVIGVYNTTRVQSDRMDMIRSHGMGMLVTSLNCPREWKLNQLSLLVSLRSFTRMSLNLQGAK